MMTIMGYKLEYYSLLTATQWRDSYDEWRENRARFRQFYSQMSK